MITDRLTVKTLIEKLQAFPPDMPVIFPCEGDGGGYEVSIDVKPLKVSAYSSGPGSYYGELTLYDSDKAEMTYKRVGCGDKEYKMFSEHFEAVLIY